MGMSRSMEAQLALIARHQHQLFSLHDAEGLGFSVRQVECMVNAGVAHRLYDEIYVFSSAPHTPTLDIAAAVMAGGELCFASGRSAAFLYDLPGQSTRTVEVTSPRWRRSQHNNPMLRVHESNCIVPEDMHVVNGIRCARPERVILDIAALGRHGECERAFMAARRIRLATFASMTSYLDVHAKRGRRGVSTVRAMLEREHSSELPTESPLEDLMLELIRAHGLPEPRRQIEVHDRSGFLVGRADFGYTDLKIVILVHSRTWHATHEDVERDESQRNQYWSAGWIPIIARTADICNGGSEFLAAFRSARAMARRSSTISAMNDETDRRDHPTRRNVA